MYVFFDFCKVFGPEKMELSRNGKVFPRYKKVDGGHDKYEQHDPHIYPLHREDINQESDTSGEEEVSQCNPKREYGEGSGFVCGWYVLEYVAIPERHNKSEYY